MAKGAQKNGDEKTKLEHPKNGDKVQGTPSMPLDNILEQATTNVQTLLHEFWDIAKAVQSFTFPW